MFQYIAIALAKHVLRKLLIRRMQTSLLKKLTERHRMVRIGMGYNPVHVKNHCFIHLAKVQRIAHRLGDHFQKSIQAMPFTLKEFVKIKLIS